MDGFLQGLEGYLSVSPILAFMAVFIAGVITSFTPCVYPMIPITIAYIGGRSGDTKLKGFSLSIFYVIGMAVTYAALGAFAALTGKLFGAASTNPILYIVVANIFIFLGLSMLDAFTLPIPSFLASRQPGKKAGGRIGAFLVGLLAGTVAARKPTFYDAARISRQNSFQFQNKTQMQGAISRTFGGPVDLTKNQIQKTQMPFAIFYKRKYFK